MVLNVSDAKSFKYNLYKKCISSILSGSSFDITIPDRLDKILFDDLNKYSMIFIVGLVIRKELPFFLPDLRKNFTGKLIAIHMFIEDPSILLMEKSYLFMFDKIFIQSQYDLRLIREKSQYDFVNYIPSPFCLIKGSDRPIRKNGIKIGLVFPKTNSSIIKKIASVVDQLVSDGYTLIGICLSSEDLSDLQEIQRECPVFMIYSKKTKFSNIIREFSSCSCMVVGTYESFWISICCNVPTVPILFDRSIEMLTESTGIPGGGISVMKSSDGTHLSISSKTLKRRIIKTLRKGINNQTSYVTANRFILGSICPLSINQILNDKSTSEINSSKNSSKNSEENSKINSLGNKINLYHEFDKINYFVGLPSKDNTWKKVGSSITVYNRDNGIFLDFDTFDTFDTFTSEGKSDGSIYLFEWVGILRCSVEQLNDLFLRKNFIGSLNTCKCLFVFNDEMVRILREKLLNLNFHINISVIFFPHLDDFKYEGNDGSITVVGAKNTIEKIKDIDLKYNDNLPNKGIIIFTDDDITYQGYISICIKNKIPFLLKRTSFHINLIGNEYPLFWNTIEEIPRLLNKITDGQEFINHKNFKLDISTFVSTLESSLFKI